MLRNKDNLIVMRYDEPERKIGGLEALIKFVDAKNKVMVEVGSYMGESSSIFANHVKSLTCVDPWLEGYDDADAASSTDMSKVEEYFDKATLGKFENIKKLKMKSVDGVKEFEDESIDLVYIDAEHTYDALIIDLKIWTKKVKKDGWICGHDWQREDLRKAIIEVLGKPDETFSDDSWCFKKSRLNEDK